MKIAFIFSPVGIRLPIDPDRIWDSERGLTGSEISFFMQAIELSRLGHDVTIFTHLTHCGRINEVPCISYDSWENVRSNDKWDAVCAWNIADPLSFVRYGVFRFLSQQCSGVGPSQRGWENYTDILAPLSHSHANQLRPHTTLHESKWRIMNNGVDTLSFAPVKKIPGRMIWASSPDRGLHRLLELWPRLKRAVPEANLNVFYDFHSTEHTAKEYYQGANIYMTSDNFELGYRARYILEALKRMKHLDINLFKSVSRRRLEQEMSEAQALIYPLDPVYYTETFGVVVLEACAAGTAPVLCSADAFGELWGSVAETVPYPYCDNSEAFFNKTVKILTDASYRETVADRCREHSKKFMWSNIAKELESCLSSRGETGLMKVKWT